MVVILWFCVEYTDVLFLEDWVCFPLNLVLCSSHASLTSPMRPVLRSKLLQGSRVTLLLHFCFLSLILTSPDFHFFSSTIPALQHPPFIRNTHSRKRTRPSFASHSISRATSLALLDQTLSNLFSRRDGQPIETIPLPRPAT